MISSTNQIKHMMEEFEREDRAKQKFMVNSDKYIFSTFDDFSDVPDEDDGMKVTLITQIKLINFECHASDKLSRDKGKFKEYYDNTNFYCTIQSGLSSLKSLKYNDAEIVPLITPRNRSEDELNEDLMESRDLFDLSISENLDDASSSCDKGHMKS